MNCDENKECPLCMEPFDFDDVNFYPCECQYQICRFCWHRLKTDENGLCPACRRPYSEHPAIFQPPSKSQLKKSKESKESKEKKTKSEPADLTKQLSHYRVMQKNLVYVIGLSQKLTDADLLQKPEYFGRFGRIFKIVVGTNGQKSSAYITYSKADDALRAIKGINSIQFGDCVLKASLGTSKYCSAFLRGQICQKAISGKTNCMYLHKIADPEASFTPEDMHAGKHLEYERKLHEDLAARTMVSSGIVEGKLASEMKACTVSVSDKNNIGNSKKSAPRLNKSMKAELNSKLSSDQRILLSSDLKEESSHIRPDSSDPQIVNSSSEKDVKIDPLDKINCHNLPMKYGDNKISQFDQPIPMPEERTH